MSNDLEAASEAVNVAWRNMVELRAKQQRSSPVLAKQHVDALHVAQRHLLTAKASISVALDHVGTLLQNAGADGAGIRTLEGLPRTTAATLTDELRRVRGKRKHI